VLEDMCISASKCIRRNADIEVKLVVPALTQLLPSLGCVVISKNLEPQEKLLEFHLPVEVELNALRVCERRAENEMRDKEGVEVRMLTGPVARNWCRLRERGEIEGAPSDSLEAQRG